jgi:hypothetical protein
MKRRILIAIVGVSALWQRESCAQFAPYDSCDRVYCTAEALFWDLSPGSNRLITINENTGEGLLRSDDADPDWTVLPRLTAVWRRAGTDCEVVYWGLGDWDDSATVVGNNNLSLPGAVALGTLDFFDADRMTITTDAEMHNVEVNSWHALGCQADGLIGFRYLNLDETFNINSFDLGSGTSDYRIDTDNHLFLVQSGLRTSANICGWHYGVSGKVGVGYGDSRQSTFLGDFNNTAILRNSLTTGDQFVFLTELGWRVTRPLSSNVFLSAGYDVLWVQNVARATEQLDFTDLATSGTALDNNGQAFLHGLNVRLVMWLR